MLRKIIAENIGKTEAEIIALWNEAHPNDRAAVGRQVTPADPQIEPVNRSLSMVESKSIDRRIEVNRRVQRNQSIPGSNGFDSGKRQSV